MIVDLTGVLEDGSPRAAGVPPNPRQTIDISIGENFTVRLRVVRSDGSVVRDGVITWTVKKKDTDSRAIFQLSTTLDGRQEAVIMSMAPADTRNQEPGLYVYDIWHTSITSGERNPVVPLSPAILEGTATPPVPAAIALTASPTSLSILLIGTATLHIIRTVNAVPTDVTASVSWSAPVNPPRVSANSAGLVTGLAVGATVLTATLGDLSVAVPVTVT